MSNIKAVYISNGILPGVNKVCINGKNILYIESTREFIPELCATL